MTNKEAIRILQQLYPNGGHCWLDEQRIEAIGMAIKALQQPVSEDLEEAAEMFIDSLIPTEVDTVTPFAAEYVIGLLNKAIEFGAIWQKEQMMAKAIRGHVGQTINGMLRALSDETFGDIGFTAGDKVKLIIIKED